MRKSLIVNFGIIGCLLMITSFTSQATYLKDLDILEVSSEDERYSSDRCYYIFDVYHGDPGKLGELHNAARNVAANCKCLC